MSLCGSNQQYKLEGVRGGTCALLIRNMPKLLGFIALSCAFAGCATPLRAKSVADSEHDLALENERLEAQVTELQEQLLKADRVHSCFNKKQAEALKAENKDLQAQIERARRDAKLPTVSLQPEVDSEEETPEVAEAPSVSLFPADERSGESASTRPVLKVRGEHEAWVYHRPLEQDERATVPLIDAARLREEKDQAPTP